MSKKENFARFAKKMVKFLFSKYWIHFTNTRNYAVTYYKTLEKVSWNLALGWKNSKNDKNFKTLKKIAKISINWVFLAIGCKPIHGQKMSSNFLSNSNGDFLFGWKTWIMTINV